MYLDDGAFDYVPINESVALSQAHISNSNYSKDSRGDHDDIGENSIYGGRLELILSSIVMSNLFLHKLGWRTLIDVLMQHSFSL